MVGWGGTRETKGPVQHWELDTTQYYKGECVVILDDSKPAYTMGQGAGSGEQAMGAGEDLVIGNCSSDLEPEPCMDQPQHGEVERVG